MGELKIRRIRAADKPEWLRMRVALWGEHEDVDELESEMETLFNDEMTPIFVAIRADGGLGGFVEAGTRKYAEGCQSSPVGFIEGWYVDADLRRQGVGAALIRAAEEWARGLGLTEMGSDTWLDNGTSIQAHLKLGYQEKERLVHFAKQI
jgi:aminoglycoside 6'-N-acetyltransferase I